MHNRKTLKNGIMLKNYINNYIYNMSIEKPSQKKPETSETLKPKKPKVKKTKESDPLLNKEIEEEKKESEERDRLKAKELRMAFTQAEDYYGDPIEDSENREQYHMNDNATLEDQRMAKHRIDSNDDIKVDIDYDEKIKEPGTTIPTPPVNPPIEPTMPGTEGNTKNKDEDVVVFASRQQKITGIAEDYARTQTSDVRGGFLKSVKNFFTNRIGYDFKRKRQADLKEKNIYTSGRLLDDGESSIGDNSLENSFKAAEEDETNATIDRLIRGSVFSETVNEKEFSEEIKDLTDENTEAIRNIIVEYAVRNTINREEFKDKISETLKDVFSEEMEENEKKAKVYKLDLKKIIETRYISNILVLANKIKADTLNDAQKEARIKLIKLKRAVAAGGQSGSEKLNKAEAVVDEIVKNVNFASGITFGAFSATAFAFGFSRNFVRAMTGVGGVVAFGSALSAVKEGRKIEGERVQVMREQAVGSEEERIKERKDTFTDIAEMVETAFDKMHQLDSLIAKITSIPGFPVDPKDKFVDIYIKLINFSNEGNKEASRIIRKDIKNTVKKYYNQEYPADDLEERKAQYLEYKKLLLKFEDVNRDSRNRERIKRFVYKQEYVGDLIYGMRIEQELIPEKVGDSFYELISSKVKRDMSVYYGVDLIEYSNDKEIEKERNILDIAIAKNTDTIRKIYETFSIEERRQMLERTFISSKDGEKVSEKISLTDDVLADFNKVMKYFTEKEVEAFNDYKDSVDKGYKKYKKTEVVKRAITTAIVSGIGIFVGQEVKALMDDKLQGLAERVLTNHRNDGANGGSHTMLDFAHNWISSLGKTTQVSGLPTGQPGGFLQSAQDFVKSGGGRVGVEDFVAKYPLHADNYTPDLFDKNELKFDIVKRGEKIFVSMSRMLPGGSARDGGVNIDPTDKIGNVFKAILVPNEASLKTPISIVLDSNGMAEMTDDIRQQLFDLDGNYIGKYIQAGAFNPGEKVPTILATIVGKDTFNEPVPIVEEFLDPMRVSPFGFFISTNRKPLNRRSPRNPGERGNIKIDSIGRDGALKEMDSRRRKNDGKTKLISDNEYGFGVETPNEDGTYNSDTAKKTEAGVNVSEATTIIKDTPKIDIYETVKQRKEILEIAYDKKINDEKKKEEIAKIIHKIIRDEYSIVYTLPNNPDGINWDKYNLEAKRVLNKIKENILLNKKNKKKAVDAIEFVEIPKDVKGVDPIVPKVDSTASKTGVVSKPKKVKKSVETVAVSPESKVETVSKRFLEVDGYKIDGKAAEDILDMVNNKKLSYEDKKKGIAKLLYEAMKDQHSVVYSLSDDPDGIDWDRYDLEAEDIIKNMEKPESSDDTSETIDGEIEQEDENEDEDEDDEDKVWENPNDSNDNTDKVDRVFSQENMETEEDFFKFNDAFPVKIDTAIHEKMAKNKPKVVIVNKDYMHSEKDIERKRAEALERKYSFMMEVSFEKDTIDVSSLKNESIALSKDFMKIAKEYGVEITKNGLEKNEKSKIKGKKSIDINFINALLEELNK